MILPWAYSRFVKVGMAAPVCPSLCLDVLTLVSRLLSFHIPHTVLTIK